MDKSTSIDSGAALIAALGRVATTDGRGPDAEALAAHVLLWLNEQGFNVNSQQWKDAHTWNAWEVDEWVRVIRNAFGLKS
ncbi:MAG: hypothetical protein M9886_07540 [Candidatus Nanopelagicales bacterium]|nr:hypothetical protein [Candidatus Nanopelagicales bacterium]